MKTQFKVFASIALVALVCIGALVVAQTTGGNGDDKDKKVEKKIEIVEENGVKTMTVTTTTDGVTTVETFEGDEVDKYLAMQGGVNVNTWHHGPGTHDVMKIQIMTDDSGDHAFDMNAFDLDGMDFMFFSDSGENNFHFDKENLEEMLENMDFFTHFEGIDGVDADEIRKEIEEAMKEMDDMDFNFNIDVSDDGHTQKVIINSSGDGEEAKVIIMGGGSDVNKWVDEDGHVIVNIEEEVDGDKKKTVVISKIIRIEDVEEGESPIESDNDLKIDNLQFYPNPSQGQFTLEFEAPEKGKTEIRVTDMTGREVYNGSVRGAGHHTHQIDISDEGKGVYLLNLIQGDKSIVKKIVLD